MNARRFSPFSHLLAGALALAPAAASIGCSGTSSGGDLTGNSSGSSGSSGAINGGGTSAGPNDPASASDGASLFDVPPDSATPDSIYGLWGGPMSSNGTNFDVRMVIGPSTMRVAVQCEENGVRPPVAVVTARARITSEEIAVLESKDDATYQSGVNCKSTLRPYTVRRCEARSGFERDCFTLAGTQLVIHGKSSFDKLSLTKISD